MADEKAVFDWLQCRPQLATKPGPRSGPRKPMVLRVTPGRGLLASGTVPG
jgi:hypothetical protein